MAFTTPSMGLIVWNQPTDPYDSTQLGGNFAKIDEHDHTPGKGVLITTAAIADGAITSDKLSSSITVPPSSVTLTELAASLVTSLVPAGAVMPFAGTAPPGGFLLCDGSVLNSSTTPAYASLYSVIGNAYGGSDNTNFKLPDIRGRVVPGLASGGATEVGTIGFTESGNITGVAVGSRKIKHKHTNGVTAAVQNHVHTFNPNDSGSVSGLVYHSGTAMTNAGFPVYMANAGAQADTNQMGENAVMNSSGAHSAVVGGTIGDAAGLTDSSAFIVLNYIIKF